MCDNSQDISQQPMVLARMQWKVDIMDIDELKELINQACTKISENICYPESVRMQFDVREDIQIMYETLCPAINNLYSQFQLKRDPEYYYAEFRCNIIEHTESFFPSMEFKFRGVLGIKLCDVLFVNMQRKKDKNVTNVVKPITKEEYDGLQYLSGYVVQKILKKASKGKQNKENNAIVNILSSAITDQFEE